MVVAGIGVDAGVGADRLNFFAFIGIRSRRGLALAVFASIAFLTAAVASAAVLIVAFCIDALIGTGRQVFVALRRLVTHRVLTGLAIVTGDIASPTVVGVGKWIDALAAAANFIAGALLDIESPLIVVALLYGDAISLDTSSIRGALLVAFAQHSFMSRIEATRRADSDHEQPDDQSAHHRKVILIRSIDQH